MSDARNATVNALHGETGDGHSYVVIHDGLLTRYRRDDAAVTTGPATVVSWFDAPAVNTPAGAHIAARSWVEPGADAPAFPL